MILRTKLLVILFTVPLYLINCCNGDITDENMNDESDEDEDDKLKQALILVDLLKTEYLRVLHENSILRNGVEVTTPAPVEEQSTCTPTGAGTVDANENITTYFPTPTHDTDDTLITDIRVAESPPPQPSGPSVPEHLPPSMSASTPTVLRRTPMPPALALSHAPLVTRQPMDMPVLQNQQQPYGYYRRRIPAEYYYYDAPMRRNLNRPLGRMYDDTPYNFRRNYGDSRTGPNKMRRFDYPDPITSDTNKPTTQTTTTVLTEQVPVSSTGSKIKITKSNSRPSATRKHTPATAARTTATKRTRSRASPEKVIIPVSGSYNGSTKILGRKPTTKDPVMAQIASELISELKEDVPSLREGNAKHGSTPSQNEVVFFKPKTTLRIHLAHSTRYPIPLPENHAFCYYSPKNPLCSTFV